MNGIAKHFAEILEQHLGTPTVITDVHSEGGGCISQGYVAQTDSQQWFIKTNRPGHGEMFAAEFAGLRTIFDTHTLRCPEPLGHGETSMYSYLVMEYLPLGGAKQQPALAGQQLALLHQQTQQQFGWHRDNTIGTTPQSNRLHDNWVDFWREERLLPQLRLALSKGYSQRDYEKGLLLCERLAAFFHSYQPVPSLLHGDLWGGNLAYTREGEPVIYDPAVYYGDREADLAMTELFGGFGTDFYAAYDEVWGIDEGYEVRKRLYNLYHVLNHFNLFGGGYGRQGAATVIALLENL